MKNKLITIILVISNISLIVCILRLITYAADKVEQKEKKVDKFRSYYNLYDYWLEAVSRGVKVENYFLENGIERIAIYGMGDLGMQLARQLENSPITVEYVIDKGIYADKVIYDMRSLEDDLSGVDAMIITPIFAYDKIESQIKSKFDCPIISIEDVVYAL
nr:hypothetical protein [uncultured Anaerosporobacter sp.]